MSEAGHIVDGDINSTIGGETKEEPGIRLTDSCEYPMVVAEEARGFVQFVAPPFNFTTAQFAMMQNGSEGVFRTFEMGDEFLSCLQDTSHWVPGGLMHMVVWLALGAPLIFEGRIISANSISEARKMADIVLASVVKSRLRQP